MSIIRNSPYEEWVEQLKQIYKTSFENQTNDELLKQGSSIGASI